MVIRTTKMKKLILCICLATFSLQNHASNDPNYNQLAEVVNDNLNSKKMHGHEKLILSTMNRHESSVNQLISTSRELNANEQRYVLNYAILKSVYAEYLIEIHCRPESIDAQKQAENIYQFLFKQQPNDRNVRYNLALFYARTSTTYRKDQNNNERYRLLKLAEETLYPNYQKYPKNEQYRNDYYAILSEQLDIVQTKANQRDEQQRLIDILKTPLFKILNNPKQNYDSGNFVILVQQYYKYLYSQNPKQADQWLISHKNKIENYVNTQQQNTQREYQFLAEFYALLNQPQKALYYLSKYDVRDIDAANPESIAKERNLANLRLNPNYQNWFKQYQLDYEENQRVYPPLCSSMQVNLDLPKQKVNN